PFLPGIPVLWDNYENKGMISGRSKGIWPLTTCTWSQDGYYNQMCPADQEGYNGHVPVGCVALAMAQLMYYYRFPDSGSGSVEYTPSYQGGVYGPQYVDFAASTYAWNEMTNICREPNNAVAQVCYHAGVALKTAYAPQSSGANIINVPAALTDHFFYLADDYLPRSEVPDTTDWVTMLMSNLDNRQPVLYRSSNGWGGHVYICDGYQDSTHFHFNWGWGGAYNGYFYIENLVPGGIDINASQGAVFNIFPDTSQFQYPGSGTDSTLLTGNTGSFEDGSGPYDYLPGSKRSWLIKPVDTNVTNLLLTFPMIDTEAGADVIRVYNGDSEEAPLLESLSGSDFPVSLYSSGPAFLVTFDPDDQNNENGFQASYYGYHLPFCSGNPLLTDATGVLGDGSSYHNYLNDTDCEWVIAPFLSPYDSVAQVSLNFTRFDLAAGDTVIIFDGPDKDSPLIGKFAQGTTPGNMISTGNKVLVNFKTDHENTAKGWDLAWDYIPPGYCHDTMYFNNSWALISDGSGGKNYVPNTDCYYVIDLPEGRNINIDFLEFDIENDYDFIKFYNAENPNWTLFKVSGHELPNGLTFDFNKLLIHFHSDDRDNFQGWKLRYYSGGAGFSEYEGRFLLGPNPVHDILTVKINSLNSSDAVYTLYRIDGVSVLSERISSAALNIDFNYFMPGMYFIVFEIDGENYQYKILKY
ncbi:MAG: T9SS type A sorting domain-containing protein, partial [Bacteroidales bacterium]|nr:T9SS type A sorting domain-containing protein [Bacteroidales bacterium]